MSTDTDKLVERLHERARIRRQIPTRKSVQEGRPDKIADLLDEAADRLDSHQRLVEATVNEIYSAADAAYCRAVQMSKSDLCLGEEYKIRSSTFTLENLKALETVRAEFGRADGLYDAVKVWNTINAVAVQADSQPEIAKADSGPAPAASTKSRSRLRRIAHQTGSSSALPMLPEEPDYPDLCNDVGGEMWVPKRVYDALRSRVVELHKGLMAEADRRVEQAERRAAENEKDAERYRWLRSEEVATNPKYYPFWQEFQIKLCREEKMDAVIDAAREKEKS